MKAVILDREQQGALTLAEVAKPELSHDHQVLVRLKAAGINPIDTKIRQAPDRFPVQPAAILGCDGAGVIEAVGSGVQGFAVGDEVYYCQCGFNGRQGNYAEYAVVDECFLAHKPEKLSFVEAAAAPLVLITAWEALHDRARISAGQTVLVHGGAGGVGHIAIQLARIAGARVITTVSDATKAAFVRDLGADETILYKERDFVAATLAWSQNEGVDIVLDTVGGDLIEQSCNAVKLYGDLVTILQLPADANWGTARKRNLRLTQELMLSPTLLEDEAAKAHQGRILADCGALFDQHNLRPVVAKTFPLAEAAAAHSFLEQEHPLGKVVLEI